ncbi:MAG: hypothetical protein B7Z73_09880, partial [Planctomycetia bacterium 21-64-5]
MKRITRQRHLTAEEAAKYQAIRDQVAAELPELLDRHYQRVAALDKIDDVLKQLKAARKDKGLSLADLSERTGMDRSALSKLESGERPNPTASVSFQPNTYAPPGQPLWIGGVGLDIPIETAGKR